MIKDREAWCFMVFLYERQPVLRSEEKESYFSVRPIEQLFGGNQPLAARQASTWLRKQRAIKDQIPFPSSLTCVILFSSYCEEEHHENNIQQNRIRMAAHE